MVNAVLPEQKGVGTLYLTLVDLALLLGNTYQ